MTGQLGRSLPSQQKRSEGHMSTNVLEIALNSTAATGPSRVVIAGEPNSLSTDYHRFSPSHWRLLHLLMRRSEAFQTMLAAEGVLRRDWDHPEEDAAWDYL